MFFDGRRIKKFKVFPGNLQDLSMTFCCILLAMCVLPKKNSPLPFFGGFLIFQVEKTGRREAPPQIVLCRAHHLPHSFQSCHAQICIPLRMSLLRSTPTQTARGVLKTNVKRVLVMSGTLGASSSCYQVPFEILRKNTSLPPLPQIKSLSGRLHKTTHGMQGIASNLLEGGFLQDDNRKAGTKKTPKVDVLLRELRWRPLKAHN